MFLYRIPLVCLEELEILHCMKMTPTQDREFLTFLSKNEARIST